MILDITISIKNISGNDIVLDSSVFNTLIEIYADSSGRPLVWRFPESYTDSSTHQITLAPDSVRTLQALWYRVDYFGQPVVPGEYDIEGKILGFVTPSMSYGEL
jgi:hypothetical protein